MFLNKQIVVFTVVLPLLLMFVHFLPWNLQKYSQIIKKDLQKWICSKYTNDRMLCVGVMVFNLYDRIYLEVCSGWMLSVCLSVTL